MHISIAGYGDLAHYMCEDFVKAGHKLTILTRNHKPELEARKGITQAVTNYTVQSLKPALGDCEVLISTISDISSEYESVHISLIQACQESPRCKRFIPAEFAANIKSYPDQPGFYYPTHEPIRRFLRNQDKLEWTLVCIGWLADYFVPANNRYIKDIGNLHPVEWSSGNITIPGTGNEPIDFTWARDVVRALELLIQAPPGSWEPYTFMSGESSCWNTATRLVQQTFLPRATIEHKSLYDVVEMVKKADTEDTLLLADYYFLSISQACANPMESVLRHRRKFFLDCKFRNLQEGLDYAAHNQNAIV